MTRDINLNLNLGAEDDWTPPIRGSKGYCPILILCDAPTKKAHELNLPLHAPHHKWLGKLANLANFAVGDIKLLGLCPPIPKEAAKSVSKQWKHVERYSATVLDKINELRPQVVVTFGALATRVLSGRPTKITKVRGMPVKENDILTFPMLSPGFVKRIPENIPIFEADFLKLRRLYDNQYKLSIPQTRHTWVEKFLNHDFYNEKFNSVLAVDTETQGGTRWWDKEVKIIL